MMQGDVNTFMADTIKVLDPKKSLTFWTSGVGISDIYKINPDQLHYTIYK